MDKSDFVKVYLNAEEREYLSDKPKNYLRLLVQRDIAGFTLPDTMDADDDLRDIPPRVDTSRHQTYIPQGVSGKSLLGR